MDDIPYLIKADQASKKRATDQISKEALCNWCGELIPDTSSEFERGVDKCPLCGQNGF